MRTKLENAIKIANMVRANADKSVVKSLNSKMISAINYQDKESFFSTLSKLSMISNVPLDFSDEYENDKTPIYAFLNALLGAKYEPQKKHIAEKYKRFPLDLKIEQHAEFLKVCEQNGVSPTSVIKKAIDDYIEKHN